MKKFKMKLLILFCIGLGCAQAEEGNVLFILSGQSNMQGLDHRQTFEPRVFEEYGKEKDLPYLKHAFRNAAPKDRNDGIAVGKLTAVQEKAVRQVANEIFDGDHGKIDSLLIAKDGKLLFESYYRRGRANYPHYQMSITKSYTAMAIGRAIQLGYLSMEDLNKPVIDFLKELDRNQLVKGAEKITLAEAMNMRSGIRIDRDTARKLMRNPENLKGQKQIQAYLEHSTPIPDAPREFKYQAADPCITMQVLDAVVPGTAKDFIKTELLDKMSITSYHWQDDISGLPKSAAGSSMRSRDMMKWGLMVMNNGNWNGEQLVPTEFVKLAVSHLHTSSFSSYGYFWWSEDVEVNGKSYRINSGRGAGGQFIFMIPETDLVIVITAHNKGMGTMRETAPNRLIPLFQ